MGWFKELLKSNKKNENVVYARGINWPTNKIFEHAVKSRLESVTIIGWTEDGRLYVNSTHAKRGDLHWDLCLAARDVLDK